MEFAWEWEGPERDWELVIMDSDLVRIFTAPATAPGRMRADAPLLALLEPGEAYFWFVREQGGEGLRTSPVLFRPSS